MIKDKSIWNEALLLRLTTTGSYISSSIVSYGRAKQKFSLYVNWKPSMIESDGGRFYFGIKYSSPPHKCMAKYLRGLRRSNVPFTKMFQQSNPSRGGPNIGPQISLGSTIAMLHTKVQLSTVFLFIFGRRYNKYYSLSKIQLAK